jgi:thiosulfate reductase cytochrome b subunit
VRGGLHRTAAVVMLAATLLHFMHLAMTKRDRSTIPTLLPTIKDAMDMLQMFRYDLGLTKQEPQFAKFNYAEKMEYWAVLWGTPRVAIVIGRNFSIRPRRIHRIAGLLLRIVAQRAGAGNGRERCGGEGPSAGARRRLDC